MGPGRLSSGAAKLSEALECLQEAWQETSQEWEDATARNFEENYLRPLLRQCSATLETTSQLQEVLTKAYRDCEVESEY
jgi:hypothetical protein